MSEQEQVYELTIDGMKKKKRKLAQVLLMTDYACLTEQEILRTVYEIRIKLKEIFRQHIGQENAISPFQLFEEIYGISPNNVDIFKKNYWWHIIKIILRQMRHDNECFVINKPHSLFVLKSKQEATDYKARCDREIEAL